MGFNVVELDFIVVGLYYKGFAVEVVRQFFNAVEYSICFLFVGGPAGCLLGELVRDDGDEDVLEEAIGQRFTLDKQAAAAYQGSVSA